MSEPNDPRYLLLAAPDAAHGRHSGYTALAEYIPDSRFVQARRFEPTGPMQRAIVGALSRLAFTRMYRLASLQIEWRTLGLVRRGHPQLIHMMWADRDWGFLDRFIGPSGPALCATFHSSPDLLPETLHGGDRLQRLDAVILMSEVQRPFFAARGVAPERIHVVHHGIDCEFFTPGVASRGGEFTVLSVGNYRRNFALLRGVCILLGRHEGIRVHVVAPQIRREFFENMAHVRFSSNLDDEALRECYRSASCLLMTAEAATANNALLEAMACGLPIVAESIEGIPEYTSADGALLCSPGSAEELADAIVRLRAHPELAARIGASAHARAADLDWPKVARRTVAVYEAALASRVRAAPLSQ
jgi:glycosyltransferase involved in cell wall biosynthesis